MKLKHHLLWPNSVFLCFFLRLLKVTVWDIETTQAKKTFHCHSHVLVLAVSPFLGLIAAGEAKPGRSLKRRGLREVLSSMRQGEFINQSGCFQDGLYMFIQCLYHKSPLIT